MAWPMRCLLIIGVACVAGCQATGTPAQPVEPAPQPTAPASPVAASTHEAPSLDPQAQPGHLVSGLWVRVQFRRDALGLAMQTPAVPEKDVGRWRTSLHGQVLEITDHCLSLRVEQAAYHIPWGAILLIEVEPGAPPAAP
jgi:hypothetical protein